MLDSPLIYLIRLPHGMQSFKTALLFAAENKEGKAYDLVELLLDCGAHIDAQETQVVQSVEFI